MLLIYTTVENRRRIICPNRVNVEIEMVKDKSLAEDIHESLAKYT